MINRTIGAFVAKGPLNLAPYQFDIERTNLHPLHSETAAVTPPPHMGMKPSAVPYLRVPSVGAQTWSSAQWGFIPLPLQPRQGELRTIPQPPRRPIQATGWH